LILLKTLNFRYKIIIKRLINLKKLKLKIQGE
jgi:hypothetical protein